MENVQKSVFSFFFFLKSFFYKFPPQKGKVMKVIIIKPKISDFQIYSKKLLGIQKRK